jgi:hypothetical protein
MAIDTLAKRASVLNIASLQLPIPDGTISQGDRQSLLRVYTGILAGAAVIVKKISQRISIMIGVAV